MAQNTGNLYVEILKYEKQSDGTLRVYGKATDDSLDIDQQICDPAWLDRAMPEWFKSGGNIREQHSSIAAGVATEYEKKADGHYIEVLVVDPNSVKKVETRVLKGFSIGIRSPRVVRDNKAVNGRIIDGMIVEVSLVDRPANPNAKLVLAKSVNGSLTQVEEMASFPTPKSLRKYDDSQERDESGRFGSGGGSEGSSGSAGSNEDEDEEDDEDFETADMREEISDSISVVQNSLSEFDKSIKEIEEQISSKQDENLVYTAYDHMDSANTHLSEAQMSMSRDMFNDAKQSIDLAQRSVNEAGSALERSENPTISEVGTALANFDLEDEMARGKSVIPTLKKFDQATYNQARTALAALIAIEAGELGAGHDERHSLGQLLESVTHLLDWFDGEAVEGETGTVPPAEEVMEMEMEAPKAADPEMCEECNKAMDECSCETKALEEDKEPVEGEPKDGEPDKEEKSDTEDSESDEDEEDDEFAEKSVNVIIAKAVESAKKAVRTEIESLRAANKAAEGKINSLEQDLITAKSAAAKGGPRRTGVRTPANASDHLFQAAQYNAKAAATTDPILAKGYAELAKDFLAKSVTPDAN